MCLKKQFGFHATGSHIDAVFLNQPYLKWFHRGHVRTAEVELISLAIFNLWSKNCVWWCVTIWNMLHVMRCFSVNLESTIWRKA